MQRREVGSSYPAALLALRHRWWVVVACALIVGASAVAFSKAQTKEYSATAALVFTQSELAEQLAGLQATNNAGNSNDVQSLQDTNVQLVELGNMASRTTAVLGHHLTAIQLRRSLAVSSVGDTNVVDVTATATRPSLAAAIANTYSNIFVSEQENGAHNYYASALNVVNKQIAVLTPAERTLANGLALQERAQSLSILVQLQSNTVSVAQAATVPTGPSSPKVLRNLVLGVLLGLIIGISAVLIGLKLDRRISDPEEFEAIYGQPLLGVVPDSPAFASDGRGNSRERPSDVEVFRLIRAHVRYFNVDREVRIVAIVSAVVGDGKTTMAQHLASAAAAMASRVLLIELDLRRPVLAARLGLAASPGVSDILLDGGHAASHVADQLAAGVQTWDVGTDGSQIDVLVGGPGAIPNPARLIESRTMDSVLAAAREAYDLVVIDTPPLMTVPDAFALFGRVDGIIVVGRLRRSERDMARRLCATLVEAQAPLIGVIANGAPERGRTGYEYYGRAEESMPRVPA